jgi:hypothetical protein
MIITGWQPRRLDVGRSGRRLDLDDDDGDVVEELFALGEIEDCPMNRQSWQGFPGDGSCDDG